jgi:hypothetical protein
MIDFEEIRKVYKDNLDTVDFDNVPRETFDNVINYIETAFNERDPQKLGGVIGWLLGNMHRRIELLEDRIKQYEQG